jgi:vancomycin aglycone glucosyltransferase
MESYGNLSNEPFATEPARPKRVHFIGETQHALQPGVAVRAQVIAAAGHTDGAFAAAQRLTTASPHNPV